MEDHEKEFIYINDEIPRIWSKMEFGLTKQDGQKIWRNFQRFAEYEDLKYLYSKVIPEISKFEGRIIDF